jgi:copper oxidase (laccase) domain-containing protein
VALKVISEQNTLLPGLTPASFIAKCNADVPEAIAETFGPAVWEYIRPIGNKFYVNLKAINALALRRAGVNHIEISTDCTRCNPHKYWSHRFHGPTRGSQGAIILCKEAKV